DLRARYDESGGTGQLVRRAVGSARGHDVALGAPGIEAVSVRSLDVTRFAVDLGRRAVDLGNIRAAGAELWVHANRPLPVLSALAENAGAAGPGVGGPPRRSHAGWSRHSLRRGRTAPDDRPDPRPGKARPGVRRRRTDRLLRGGHARDGWPRRGERSGRSLSGSGDGTHPGGR